MKLNAEWQRSPAQGMAGSEPPSGSRGFTGSAGRISYASGCSAVSVRFSQVCFPLYRVSNLDSVMSSHWSGTWPSRLTADCDDPVRDSGLAPPPTAYSGLLHQVDLVLRAPPRGRQTHIPSSRCTSRGDGATRHSRLRNQPETAACSPTRVGSWLCGTRRPGWGSDSSSLPSCAASTSRRFLGASQLTLPATLPAAPSQISGSGARNARRGNRAE